MRRALLTTHIVCSVALLGDVAGILASAYDVLALSLATGLSVYKPRLKVTT